ncbi:M48 family metallopeptidase [Luteimonas salinilitoris]|uniref:M48 family metallopeptidase n=1 Tax=Luteimonas salinilitoris TaxID=3237697 RepID=A0ABV4HM18_9GAMM
MRSIHFIPASSLLLFAGLFAAGTAAAIDLGGKLGAGLKAGRALTLSDQEVIASAEQACAHMDASNPVATQDDPDAVRLASITDGLANEDGLSLDFKVYKTDDVNAWAMANGCVRVYSGLMDVASDDEIRGVIGHEIGHVKLGHTKSKMRTALLSSSAREGLSVAGGSQVSALASGRIGELAEGVVNAQFSQKEEGAADEYGYGFMMRHQYDPAAMVTMFRKLSSEGGLMSSHPGSEARARRIEGMIAKGR